MVIASDVPGTVSVPEYIVAAPEYLKKGDTVIVVSPSGLIEEERLANARGVLSLWGLNVLEGEYALSRNGIFAGTDQARRADVQWAINHPTAKAIIFSRGGYGAARIIEDIDFSALERYPKWFVGFSDITVFHSRLALLSAREGGSGVPSCGGVAPHAGATYCVGASVYAKVPSYDGVVSHAKVPSYGGVVSHAGVPSYVGVSAHAKVPSYDGVVSHAGVSSIHAAMPQTYPLDFSDRALTSLHDLLFGDGIDFSWQSPFFKSGSVTAPLVGGNLSVLYSLRGTPIDLDVNGKILLLEDLNEMDYHIDRMFQNLKQGGWFSRIAGLIIGQFTDIKQGIRAFPEPFEDMIKEYTLGYNIPIAINAPIGHIPSQQAVYLNTPAVFEVSSDGLAVVRQ